MSELQKQNEKGQRTNIKSSIFALLVELVSKVAKHGCRNQRESVGHGNTQQAGNYLIVEKKLTLRIKFVFGSFPARNETFWCFLLPGFPPTLLFSFWGSQTKSEIQFSFFGITSDVESDFDWKIWNSDRSDPNKIRELKPESEVEIEIELKPNFIFPHFFYS